MKISELNAITQQRREQFGTNNNFVQMFPVGSKVRVICVFQDTYPFHGDETGVVVPCEENQFLAEIQQEFNDVIFDPQDEAAPERVQIDGSKVKVKFDVPRKLKEKDFEFIQETYNFDPRNILLIKDEKKDENIVKFVSNKASDVKEIKIKKYECVISFISQDNYLEKFEHLINEALKAQANVPNFEVKKIKINKKRKF